MQNEKAKIDLDSIISHYLSNKQAQAEGLLPIQGCPSELELSDYLEHQLSEEKNEALLKHLADCPHCLSLLVLAQEAQAREQDAPSAAMLLRAKNIFPVKPHKIRSFSKHKWPILATISFILSFFFTQYFLQFLILAIVFSVKWIFDTASTRTLIMIYEAWRKKDTGTTQEIIRDLRDKIEQRK